MSILAWINIAGACFVCGGACVIGRELMAWHKTLKEWSTVLELRQCLLDHQVPDPFAARPLRHYPELVRGKQVPYAALFATTADPGQERPRPVRHRAHQAQPQDAEWDRDLPSMPTHPCSFEGCPNIDVRHYCVGCVEFPDKHRVMVASWLCTAHTEVYLMGIPEEARNEPSNPWRFRELEDDEAEEGGEDGVK